MSDNDWMSVEEAAAALGGSRRTAYNEIKRTGFLSGDIPAIRVGSRIRLPRRIVETIVERRMAERRAS